MATVIKKNIDDTRIGVYEFTDKKKPRLCVVKGNEITSYAVFNSMESAEEFMDELARFLGMKPKEGGENDGKEEN